MASGTTGRTVPPVPQNDAYSEVFGDKQRILLVFAHPDDMEINCGGLVARLCYGGKKVRLVCCTSGERGTREQVVDKEEFRERRQGALFDGAAALGMSVDTDVFPLGIPDGEVEDTIQNIERIVWHIRDFRPEIVITHEPSEYAKTVDGSYWYINHRDHRKTASLAIDAVYPYSRDEAFSSSSGLRGHTVRDVLMGDAFDRPLARRFDVTEHIDDKRRALRVHERAGAMTEEEFEVYASEGEVAGRYFEVLAWLTDLR